MSIYSHITAARVLRALGVGVKSERARGSGSVAASRAAGVQWLDGAGMRTPPHGHGSYVQSIPLPGLEPGSLG